MLDSPAGWSKNKIESAVRNACATSLSIAELSKHFPTCFSMAVLLRTVLARAMGRTGLICHKNGLVLPACWLRAGTKRVYLAGRVVFMCCSRLFHPRERKIITRFFGLLWRRAHGNHRSSDAMRWVLASTRS